MLFSQQNPMFRDGVVHFLGESAYEIEVCF